MLCKLTAYCSSRNLSFSSLVEGDTVPTIWKAGSREARVSSASASSEDSPGTHVDKNCQQSEKTYYKLANDTPLYINNITLAACLATWAMCLDEYLSTSLMKIRLGRICCFLTLIFKNARICG